MKRLAVLTCALVLLPAVAGTAAAAPPITGDYLEVRTADVYTGSCFANSEVNLRGEEAILAWHVEEGSFGGVLLAGLSVVAVVRAQATLGDPFADPFPARAVVLVDERGNAEQRRALAAFAREQAGDLLADVIEVRPVAVELELGDGHGEARLEAGDLASVRTRPLHEGDLHCSNEEVYYPPLTAGADAHPAFTLVHEYRGEGLGGTWSSPDKRSAFVGSFGR